jgi:hypothetical protein
MATIAHVARTVVGKGVVKLPEHLDGVRFGEEADLVERVRALTDHIAGLEVAPGSAEVIQQIGEEIADGNYPGLWKRGVGSGM